MKIVNLVTSLSKPKKQLTVVLFFLISVLCVQYLLYLHAKQDYVDNISDLGIATYRFAMPNEQLFLQEHWLDPGARMVTRIFHTKRNLLLYLSGNLKKGRTAYDLWVLEGRKVVWTLDYYYLALLAGDLTSSYRIIYESVKKRVNPEELYWLNALTNTYWQAANEYLHELDFRRATVYNNLYLSLSKEILGARDSFAEESGRNRTLSHILQREIYSKRIYSLCDNPGVENSFGHLLGGDWGELIPSKLFVNLEARRKQNNEIYCNAGGALQRVDYVFGSSNCSAFPLECEYNFLVDNLDNHNRRDIKKRLKAFAAVCSYLGDDLLVEYLNHLELSNWPSKSISIGVIHDTLRCADILQSDYLINIENRLNEIPANAIYCDINVTGAVIKKNRRLESLSDNCI